MKKGKTLKIVLNAPLTLGFTALCFLAVLLSILTGGASTRLLFSTYRASLLDPLTYLRFFTHVLGHADWPHVIGNAGYLLLLGPVLEEKHGAKNLLIIMAVTALVTGIAHFILFPNVALLGASGIVFAMILMASFTAFKSGEIPVTVILVAIVYLGQQVYDGLFIKDNISNLTHILGGVVGGAAGYILNKK